MALTPASTHHSKKSGKGQSDGVMTDLVTLFEIKPSYKQRMRAALQLHVADGAATVHGMFPSAMAGAVQP
jgi:hypothetical protein